MEETRLWSLNLIQSQRPAAILGQARKVGLSAEPAQIQVVASDLGLEVNPGLAVVPVQSQETVLETATNPGLEAVTAQILSPEEERLDPAEKMGPTSGIEGGDTGGTLPPEGNAPGGEESIVTPAG